MDGVQPTATAARSPPLPHEERKCAPVNRDDTRRPSPAPPGAALPTVVEKGRGEYPATRRYITNPFTAVAVWRALCAGLQSTFATFACDLNRERKPLPQVVLSFCAPRAAARHLPVTMRQASLCRVRPTVVVVATHRCAPPPPPPRRGRTASNLAARCSPRWAPRLLFFRCRVTS